MGQANITDGSTVVGQRIRPVQGVDKTKGKTIYPSDIDLPGMLWAKILRSPHARAKILNIDTSKAEALQGVEAVITHKDVPKDRFEAKEGNEGLTILGDEVRYVGDAVAAVAAVDQNVAEEALQLIKVDYEVLPALFEPEKALHQDAPTCHPYGNVMYGDWNSPTLAYRRGNVDDGLGKADVIIEREFHQASTSGIPMEPRACVAQWDGKKLTVWDSSQRLFGVKQGLCQFFALAPDQVRVITSNIGGGFGVKECDRHSFISPLLAIKANKPVKLWYSREDESLDCYYRPGLTHRIKAGATKDGRLTAIQAKTYYDGGAWAGFGGAEALNLAGAMCSRVMDLYHKCPDIHWEIYCVRTNHPKTGPVRGRSDVESHFPIECILDELAEEIGMDPIEFKLKHLLRAGDVLEGHLTVDILQQRGKTISSLGTEECVDAGKKAIDWDRRNKAPDQGEGPKKRGIGMAVATHNSGSTQYYVSEAKVDIDSEGRVSLLSGSTDQGSEQQTTMRQMVAEVLRLPMEAIGGISGDTEVVPLEGGPIASRTVYAHGIAVTRAAQDARSQLLKKGAELLGQSPEEIELKEGLVSVKNKQGKGLTIGEVVKGCGGMIHGEGRFSPREEPLVTQGFAATFAEVEVDTDTGKVEVLRLVSANDAGRAINPLVVEGQIQGGAAQGIGLALMEGVAYDPPTGTMLNQWFLDSGVPSILDVPDVEPIIIEPWEPTHPFGAKGCSEISVISVAPAIANAISNAIGERIYDLPMTPDRVLKAIQEGGNR